MMSGRLPTQKGIRLLFAWIDAARHVLLNKAGVIGDTANCDSECSQDFVGRIRAGTRVHSDALRVLFDALMDEVHENSAFNEASVQMQIQNGVQLSKPFFERSGQLKTWEELELLSNEDLAARQLEGDFILQRQEFARTLKDRFRAQRDERDEHAFPNLYLKGKFLRFLPLSFSALVDRVSWRIALINFHDYWARGVQASEFPIQGFAAKYHTQLLMLADEHFRTQSSL